jgi:hypothetical protein
VYTVHRNNTKSIISLIRVVYFCFFSGLSSLVTLTGQSAGNAILGIFNVILVTANAVANVLLMTKVHAIYKRTDASFTKAQEEFFSNQHVQNATQAAMQTAARHTVNNMFAPNAPQTQNSGPRF